MSSLRFIDAELVKYVQINKIPEIYEALLSGLAIMCPEDPVLFITEKLKILRENGITNIQWDMFIDESMRPPARFLLQYSLDVFDWDDIEGKWFDCRKGRQAVAYSVLNRLHNGIVCRRILKAWNDVSNMSKKTREYFELDLSSIGKLVSDRVAPRLLSKCRPYLVRANLRGCDRIGVETFFALRECRNLQDLNLSSIPLLNDDMLRLVMEGCRILLYLNVSYTQITDASMRNISTNLNNLQYLSLAGCKKFTDNGLLYLAGGKGAKKLLHVDLSGCDQITVRGYATLAGACKALQCLVLNDLTTISDTSLEHLVTNCRKVQSLSLVGSGSVRAETIEKLAGNKKLQRLMIESNDKIGDQSVRLLCKSCPELRYVYLVNCSRITDMSLKALAFCSISVLNLADCVRLTDHGIRALMDGVCGMRLKEFDLTNCVCIGDISVECIQRRGNFVAYLNLSYCERVTDTGLALLSLCHSLASIDITGSNITDQGLSALGDNARLRYVSLSQCNAITDIGIEKFAQKCVLLERLDISHCTMITDGAIKTLAFCCRLLMHINVSGCQLLTDLAVQYLSAVCHHLTSINLSGCYLISDKSLKCLKDGCPKLKTLVLLYCKGISKQGVSKISRAVSDIKHSDETMPEIISF